MFAGGGCLAAVTARTRCGWVMFLECSELLYGRRFPLRLKGAVCRSCVRPAILIIIIIIMVIFKCYFSGELIAFHKKYFKKQNKTTTAV